tara:strand:- start:9 stop:572 length:564 start_codon:yes stop_codon:yes gene_type:complete
MQTIFKEAVNEILGGKDGICAWMGQTLRAKALRLELWRNRDESDPDYKRWLKLTGLENFEEEKEIAEFAKWVSLASGLIDGQEREFFGMFQDYSLDTTVKYRSDQQLKLKQARSPKYSKSEHDRLRNEDELVWSWVQSAEETEIWPEGSYDELKAKLRERLETVKGHKESPYKEARIQTLTLAISEL